MTAIVGITEPRYAYPIPHRESIYSFAGLHHRTHDLMPRDQGKLRIFELPVDHVQIGPAHAANVYANENLLRFWNRNPNIADTQRFADRV